MSNDIKQPIEELARRANAVPTKKPRHWCHDCKHFVAWLDKCHDCKDFVAWLDKEPAPRIDCPGDYNPCTKGHEMKFMAPEHYGDDYGFYLRVCHDRELLEAEE